MNYNIYELKIRPVINFVAAYYWHKKLTNDEIFEWRESVKKEFNEKFPNGSKWELSCYLDESAQIIENEYKSIHLPGELV